MVAQIKIGFCDKLAFVASLAGVQKIPAAVIATKANAVCVRSCLVSKRPGDQKFGLSFLQYSHHLGKRDLFHTRAASGNLRIKHQTNIQTRASALLAAFTTTTVAYPKLVLRLDQVPSSLVRTNIMHGDISLVHDGSTRFLRSEL